MRESTTLLEVNLTGNMLTNKTAQCIVRNYKSMISVRKINIENNLIHEGFRLEISMIEKNRESFIAEQKLRFLKKQVKQLNECHYSKDDRNKINLKKRRRISISSIRNETNAIEEATKKAQKERTAYYEACQLLMEKEKIAKEKLNKEIEEGKNILANLENEIDKAEQKSAFEEEKFKEAYEKFTLKSKHLEQTNKEMENNLTKVAEHYNKVKEKCLPFLKDCEAEYKEKAEALHKKKLMVKYKEALITTHGEKINKFDNPKSQIGVNIASKLLARRSFLKK